MNARGLTELRNSINVARWHMRYALTGGRDLLDMRTNDERTQWADIICQVRECQRNIGRVKRIACGEFMTRRRVPFMLRKQAE